MADKPKPTAKKSSQSAANKRASAKSETKLVRELAEILNDTDLSEIEIKTGDLKIRVSKNGGHYIQAAMQAPVMATPASAALASSAASSAHAAAQAGQDAPQDASQDYSTHPGLVKSPMVGTAYIRPSPDAEQFVKVGDSVKEGDTVLLIEAMKTFNPITAERSGKVEALLIDDAQPVEFGEPLFIIA